MNPSVGGLVFCGGMGSMATKSILLSCPLLRTDLVSLIIMPPPPSQQPLPQTLTQRSLWLMRSLDSSFLCMFSLVLPSPAAGQPGHVASHALPCTFKGHSGWGSLWRNSTCAVGGPLLLDDRQSLESPKLLTKSITNSTTELKSRAKTYSHENPF